MSIEAGGVGAASVSGAIMSSPSFEAAPSLGGNMGTRFDSISKIDYEDVLAQAEAILEEGREKLPGKSPIPARFLKAFSHQTQNQEPAQIASTAVIWEEVREAPDLTADMLIRAFKAQEAVKAHKTTKANPTVENNMQPKVQEFVFPPPFEYISSSLTGTGRKEEPAPAPEPVLVQTELMDVAVEQQEEKVESTEKEVKEVEVTKRRLVLDAKALARRLFHISLAVAEVFKRGKKSGKDVEALMPEEYSEVRSGILEEDNEKNIPDGSYELTRYGIKQIGEVSSPGEMIEKMRQIAQSNKPLRRANDGEDGEVATPAAVEIVYRHKDTKPPVEQVRLRVIKKKEVKTTRTVVNGGEEDLYEEPENPQVNSEERIEDNPDLAKLFKLAA